MRTTLRFLLTGAVLAAAACFAACGGGGSNSAGSGGGFSGPGGANPSGGGGKSFDSIDVEPPSASFKIALGKTATQKYKAFGVSGGNKTEITSTCSFEVDDQFGSLTGATLTVAAHGGKTDVHAACGSQTGKSTLTVDLTGSIVTGAGTPPNAAQLFQGATAGTDPTRQPAVEYPLDQAVAPLNIPSVEIAVDGGGNDLFHVALSSPH